MGNEIDVKGLERDLRRAVRGEVRFDAGSRALYATDGSNYRQVPIGVVLPRDAADVIAAVEAARRYGAPVLGRGGGTSRAGQCCNVAVVIDMSKYMNRVLEIDPARKLARVQPGTILDDLRHAAEQHRLTFGPDPATHTHCTLGGMIGNNSCGVHSVMAGRTADNVEELEILTYDGIRMRVGRTADEALEQIVREGGRRGQIYAMLRGLRDRYADQIRERYPRIPRRVSGYNLDELLPEQGFHVARALVGTESTCVMILEAVLNLVDSPKARSLLVLGFKDIYTAADQVPFLMEHHPIGLEAIDDRLIEFMRAKGLEQEDVDMLPKGNSWLMMEFGGESRKDSDGQANRVMEALRKKNVCEGMKLFDNRRQEKRIWEIREAGLGSTAYVPGMKFTWEGWEDAAVPPEKVGDYLRDFRKLLDRYGYDTALYGHFGQGCIHCRITFDLETKPGIRTFRAFLNDAADLVVSYGGSISGEHGDGQSKAVLLPKMFGKELVQAFGEFKAIWDPDKKMNPGKIVDAYLPDENLRLGTAFAPKDVPTRFTYPLGSFWGESIRCVGVGECRRMDHGTMCPSFMVTREERHSTRGRAHLLFEMMRGDAIGHTGWHDEAVKESLDLCLSCKGCKGDCPVNVDMATYKAEFLSHYYEGRIRPRQAYAFGLIHWWSRLGEAMPGAANALSGNRVTGSLLKWVAGMAPERAIPQFGKESFRKWHARTRRAPEERPDLLLWADTFNNAFHPETAIAAAELLGSLGLRVAVPQERLCCGRPLYDFGMLGLARRLLERTLKALREEIRAGTPIVVLEPSCAAVFRDELLSFFPHDEDAKRLSKQVKLLEEYLVEIKDKLPRFAGKRKALVHGHCHQRALFKMRSMLTVLEAVGIEADVPDDGCCGMAGSFGFEKGEHYDVSMKAGERVLLPAVRKAEGSALLIADGFSCREQIAQATGRRALHSADVLRMAFDEGQAARSRGPELERPKGLDVPQPKDEKAKQPAKDIEKGKEGGKL